MPLTCPFSYIISYPEYLSGCPATFHLVSLSLSQANILSSYVVSSFPATPTHHLHNLPQGDATGKAATSPYSIVL